MANFPSSSQFYKDPRAQATQKSLHSLATSAPRGAIAKSIDTQSEHPNAYYNPYGERLFKQRFPGVTPTPVAKPSSAKTGSRQIGIAKAPSHPVSDAYGYYGQANHEAEHAFQQDQGDELREVGPTIGDMVFSAEQFKQTNGKPLKHSVAMGNGVSHDINWMNAQAKQHGYWNGRPMSDLIFNTPEGQQYLKMISGMNQAPPQSIEAQAASRMYPDTPTPEPPELQASATHLQKQIQPTNLVQPSVPYSTSAGMPRVDPALVAPAKNVSMPSYAMPTNSVSQAPVSAGPTAPSTPNNQGEDMAQKPVNLQDYYRTFPGQVNSRKTVDSAPWSVPYMSSKDRNAILAGQQNPAAMHPTSNTMGPSAPPGFAGNTPSPRPPSPWMPGPSFPDYAVEGGKKIQPPPTQYDVWKPVERDERRPRTKTQADYGMQAPPEWTAGTSPARPPVQEWIDPLAIRNPPDRSFTTPRPVDQPHGVLRSEQPMSVGSAMHKATDPVFGEANVPGDRTRAQAGHLPPMYARQLEGANVTGNGFLRWPSFGPSPTPSAPQSYSPPSGSYTSSQSNATAAPSPQPPTPVAATGPQSPAPPAAQGQPTLAERQEAWRLDQQVQKYLSGVKDFEVSQLERNHAEVESSPEYKAKAAEDLAKQQQAAKGRELAAHGPSLQQNTDSLNRRADGMSAANDRAEGFLRGDIKDTSPYGSRNFISPYGSQDAANWASMPKGPTQEELIAENAQDIQTMKANEAKNNAAMQERETNAVADPAKMRKHMATTTRDYYNYRKGGGELGMKDWAQGQASQGKLDEGVKAQLAHNYGIEWDQAAGEKLYTNQIATVTPQTGRRNETDRDRQMAASHDRRVADASAQAAVQQRVVDATRHGANPGNAWGYYNNAAENSRMLAERRAYENQIAANGMSGVDSAINAVNSFSAFNPRKTYEDTFRGLDPAMSQRERHEIASAAAQEDESRIQSIIKLHPQSKNYFPSNRTPPNWSTGKVPGTPSVVTSDPNKAEELKPKLATNQELQAVHDTLILNGNPNPTRADIEEHLRNDPSGPKTIPPMPEGSSSAAGHWYGRGPDGLNLTPEEAKKRREAHRRIWGKDIPEGPQHGDVEVEFPSASA